MLPSLQKDDVAIYYVSRTSNTDGVGSLLDKVDQVSADPIPESWRSEVTLSTPAIYIYTSGTTGKKKEDSQRNGPLLKELNVGLGFHMFSFFDKTYQKTNTSEDLTLCLRELILFHSIRSHLGFSKSHLSPPSWCVEKEVNQELQK